MSFSLKLLGGLTLAGEHDPLSGPAVQRHRLALLALLATVRPRAVSRDKLMAWLWPERDSEPARRLLNQAVHALRQALGADAILSVGDDLQLDTDVVRCDVVAFEDALASGAPERAVALYTGAFLDGFFLDDAPEFERWVDRERDRLAAAYAKALEGLAEAAEQGGDSSAAVERWKVRAAHDPYDSRVALRLMQALERTGNRAGALQHAVLHQQLLRDELEIEPIPEVRALVERLRGEPTPAAVTKAAVTKKEESAAPAARDTAPEAFETAAETLAPGKRRALAYGAAIILLAAAAGGAMRLASGSGKTGRVTTTSEVDQIAQAVARELARRERGDTADRSPEHRTRSIPAYELYLRGNDPANLRSDSTARLALGYFQQAVALDSSYAAAWLGLARLTMRVPTDSPAKAIIVAEAAVRKALALDDSLAEGYAILGMMRAQVRDYVTAERLLKRAVALDPNRSWIRERLAQHYVMTGRPVEALAEAERAASLAPMSPSATAELARALLANDRCEEALARLETIARLNPPLLRAPSIALECYVRLGRWREATAVLGPRNDSGDPAVLALLGYMFVRAGQRDEALSIQEHLLDRWRRHNVSAYNLAFVPAALGDRDQTFVWLERAIEDGSLSFGRGPSEGLSDLVFLDLRDDPRMRRLRARLGIQNE